MSEDAAFLHSAAVKAVWALLHGKSVLWLAPYEFHALKNVEVDEWDCAVLRASRFIGLADPPRGDLDVRVEWWESETLKVEDE